MDAIQMGLACRELRSLTMKVMERTGLATPPSVAPDALTIVSDALVGGRCELEHLRQLTRVRDELVAYHESFVGEYGIEAWETRLWGELAEGGADLVALMVGAEFQVTEAARMCQDPMAHVTFLACGLSVPADQVAVWRAAVDDGSHPIEALEAVGRSASDR